MIRLTPDLAMGRNGSAETAPTEKPSTVTGPTSGLAGKLNGTFRSTRELLDLLVPPLAQLSLLSDHDDFVRQFSHPPDSFDSQRFLRRQIGLVQKVLVERVWPDWEHALEAEYGPGGLLVLERYVVPPAQPVASTSTSTDADAGADIAVSAYGVLCSLLSVKTAANLQPRSLELVLHLLTKLSARFSVDQLYAATLGLAYVRSNAGSPAARSEESESNGGDDEADDSESRLDPALLLTWQTLLKDMMSVPTRAANAAGARQANTVGGRSSALLNLPRELGASEYYRTTSLSFVSLLWRLSGASAPVAVTGLETPLSALLRQPTFAAAIAPEVVPRLLPPTEFPAPAELLLQKQRHARLWRSLIAELPSSEQQRLLRGWIRHLDERLAGRDSPMPSDLAARGTAFLLGALFGPLDGSASSTFAIVSQVLVEQQNASSGTLSPRVALAWAESENAKVALLKVVMRAWSAPEEIKKGNEARRLYLTTLLLLLVVALPIRHQAVVTLSRSPDFLEAVSSHLSLVAPLTRLLGMLVAEIVSSRTVDPAGKVNPLDFGEEIWGGDGPGKAVIRDLRAQLREVEDGREATGWQEALRATFCADQDVRRTPQRSRQEASVPLQPTSVEEPAPVKPKRPLISIIGDDEDDDDDLEPYDLPPPPSDKLQAALDSEDPALYHSAFPSQSAATSGATGAPSQTRKRGRLRPPVYVPELVSYLKGKDPQGAKEEADDEAERVELGLREGESLIRRKAGWGGELRENAVDLAFALMGLQNQFELDDFDRLKQDMLVALVTACPQEVAPAVIEQYFTDSYSIAQRHVLLASLAFACRELAGLPLPPSVRAHALVDTSEERFPSKQLPPALHSRLLDQQTKQKAISGSQLELLAANLTNMALSGAREDAETMIPEAAKEKLLAVNRTTRRSAGLSKPTQATATATFGTLAAEVFILPLLNRFWLYLRDEVTSSRSSAGTYLGGSATPQLLEPIVLSRFLATVTVLVHAARHSPAFLAVIVPETLSFLLTLRPSITSAGSKLPQSFGPAPALDEDLVTATALELALAALDGTIHLDGGRMLMSSSVADGAGAGLVADIKDWAEEVFEAEERKGGDMAVGRPGRAAAGVLLRIEEIVGKWRLSVGW